MNTILPYYKTCLFFLIGVLIFPTANFAQSNDAKNTANQIVSFYKNKDYNGLVDLIYPPIFEGVTNDSLENLKKEYAKLMVYTPEGFDLNYRFENIKILDISEVKSVDSISYSNATISMDIIIFSENPAQAKDKNFTKSIEEVVSVYEVLSETKYDKKNQTILISEVKQPFLLIKTPSFKKWHWFSVELAIVSQNEQLYDEIIGLINKNN